MHSYINLVENNSALKRTLHDIRLPLAGIESAVLALETLRVDDLSASFSDFLDRNLACLGRQARSMKLISDSILGSGNRSARNEPLDLKTVLEEIIQDYSSQLKARRIRVRLDLDERCCRNIRLDRSGLEQVLLNLWGNALRFCSSPGQIVWRVSMQKNWLQIELEDNGPGLTVKGKTQELWNGNNYGRGGGGFGLGLRSAFQAAREMGGFLEVVPPKILRGACFLVVLPAGSV